MLNKHITLFDVAVIMHANNMAQISVTPAIDGPYVEGINNLALAAQFSRSEEQAAVALQEDIASMARKFAPVKYQYEQQAQAQQAPAPQNTTE